LQSPWPPEVAADWAQSLDQFLKLNIASEYKVNRKFADFQCGDPMKRLNC